MLNIKTCHLIKFPTGKYGYVGSIPVELGDILPADVHAILGCRTFMQDGRPMMFKAKIFNTEAEARNFAASKGVTVI